MGFIYKPSTRKGPVFLSPTNEGAPTITGPDGQTYTGVPANQRGGAFYNEGNYQWVFPSQVIGLQGAQINFGSQSGIIKNGAQDWRGNDLTSWQTTGKGSIGDPGSTGGGSVPGGFAPGNIGYGSFPAFQNFPSPFLSNYSPIKAAPYKFTDPFKFAEKYGNFSRDELRKNFDQSQDLALESLGTELKGLFGFTPAAAALKRGETSLDNQFNQQERLKQLQSTMPRALEDLVAQGDRARDYASGNLPDAQQNKAFELGLRSNAADQASSGGFGATSGASRKLSDLMSAESRFKIAQYGEQLTTGNIGTKAALLLAPTEYSNAGSQINANPSLSGSQLTGSYFSQANQYGAVPATTALQSETQQNQFVTGNEQNTRTFNATNQLQNEQFNVSNQNKFALDEFGYNVGYAGAVAGAAQTNTNTNVALQQQQQYQQFAMQMMQQQQQSAQTSSILSGLASLFGQKTGKDSTIGGDIFGGIANWVTGLFGGSGGGSGGGAGDFFSLSNASGAADAFSSLGGKYLTSGSGLGSFETSAITNQTMDDIKNFYETISSKDYGSMFEDFLYGTTGFGGDLSGGLQDAYHGVKDFFGF